jgi:hypothetical protein
VLLLAGLLAVVCRRKVQAWIEEAVLPLPRFLAGAARSLARGLKADGKLNAWVLLALCLLGAVLRIRFLFQPAGFDEADTFLSYVSRPLFVALSWYPQPNNHLFHTLLVHYAWRMFGEQEWVIRLPALFAGILLIPVTYWAARALYERHSALLAAGLAAAASPLVAYSVNGRGYTLVCVLFLALLITGRYLLEHDSPPAWLLWALVAALGLYTIPIMLYAVGAAALWLVLSSRAIESGKARRQFRGRLGWALAITAAVTAMLYSPVLIASGWRPLLANSYVRSRTFAYLFANLPGHAGKTWDLWTANAPPPLTWLLAAGLVIALVCHRRIATHHVPVPLAAALSIAVLLLVQRVVPFTRVWLFLLPLCAMVSSSGLWHLLRLFRGRAEARSSGLPAAVALSCFLLMGGAVLRGMSVSSRSALDGIEDIAVWLKGRLTPGSVVVAGIPATAPLSYYFRRHRVPLINRPAPCDAMALVYSSTGSFTGTPASGEMRVLTVVDEEQQTLQTVLSAACLTGQAPPVAMLVYGRPGLSVYESYIGPGAGMRVRGSGAEK